MSLHGIKSYKSLLQLINQQQDTSGDHLVYHLVCKLFTIYMQSVMHEESNYFCS